MSGYQRLWSRPYWLFRYVEVLLRRHVQETGDNSLDLSQLTSLCCKAAQEADGWYEYPTGRNHDRDGEIVTQFLAQQYHNRYSSPRQNGYHRYKIMLLQHTVREFAEVALSIWDAG